MDPATIALTVAGLLATKAAEAAADQAGKGAWGALTRLAEAVRARFGGDPEVTQTLDRLDAKPTSQVPTQELAEVLQPRLAADPEYTAELARLVDQAKTDPRVGTLVTLIQGNAQVGKVTTIGSVTGDVHF
jgi:hypothetical protein